MICNFYLKNYGRGLTKDYVKTPTRRILRAQKVFRLDKKNRRSKIVSRSQRKFTCFALSLFFDVK